jgi:DNA primase
LSSRGDDILLGGDFYWTPNKANSLNRRIIIPFYWENEVVGWTARVIDNSSPMRYFSEVQPRYLFNTDAIKNDWEYIFICEGPFDGIAINGIAMLGDKVMPDQARWLNQTGKKIIVVPDRVEQGGKLVDVALSEGWHVSFPRWDQGIKDAADAVKAYGKLYTVWSIIDAMTKNKLEIGVRRQRLI